MSKAIDREKREERLFEKLEEARSSYDAVTYARLARLLGYDDGTDLHQELMERAAADEIYRRKSLERIEGTAEEREPIESQERPVERRDRSIFDMNIFEQEVEAYRARYGSVELSPYEHIDTKRRILRASGLNYLLVSKGHSVPIAEAKPERVGRAFLRTYNILQRRNRQKIGSGE